MRALVFDRGAMELRDVSPPTPGAGETRVRVLRAGVCATDLALARGYMGFSGIPGHEFVGVAEDGPLAGHRVVGEINAGCGEEPCQQCPGDVEKRHCPKRTVLGILGRSGAFAERLALPHTNLLPVPDSVSTEAATFVEPLAAAFEIDAQIDLASIERALVCGDGRLGLLCAQVLALRGVDVTIAGRHPGRRSLLPQTSIAYAAPGQLTEPATDRFDLVVEATGKAAVLPQALAQVRPRGTLVLKTTTERPITIDLAPLVVDEITMLGSRCGAFAPALEALADGSVAVEPMIEARYKLEEAPRALAHAGRGGVLKVLLEIG